MMEMRKARQKESGKEVVSQGPEPTVYQDLLWVWSAFCFLSDRRSTTSNGPCAISVESMESYLRMSNRYHYPYVNQVLKFIPALDREYLHHTYKKQSEELEKQRKKAERKSPRR